MFNPLAKKHKKKIEIKRKFSTVYSESESDWNSSVSDNKNSDSKQGQILNICEVKKLNQNKISGFETVRSSHIKNDPRKSLLHNNCSDSIYSEDTDKIKDNIIKMIHSKLQKFKVSPKNAMCKEKQQLCRDILVQFELNNLDVNSINKLQNFQVEFSNIYKLAQKYIRSLNISLKDSSNLNNMNTSRNISFIPHKKSQGEKLKIKVNKFRNRSIISSHKTKFNKNLTINFKNKIEKNQYKHSSLFEYLNQSKQITSWLESKIETARNFSPINTSRPGVFTPLNSGGISSRKYRNPLNTARSRNTSLNSSKVSINSKPILKNSTIKKKQIIRVFSPNPNQLNYHNRL